MKAADGLLIAGLTGGVYLLARSHRDKARELASCRVELCKAQRELRWERTRSKFGTDIHSTQDRVGRRLLESLNQMFEMRAAR